MDNAIYFSLSGESVDLNNKGSLTQDCSSMPPVITHFMRPHENEVEEAEPVNEEAATMGSVLNEIQVSSIKLIPDYCPSIIHFKIVPTHVKTFNM